MILNIANRDVEVKTGVRFLKELDKRYTLEQEGVKIGFGLNQLSINFSMRNVGGLAEAIECATRTAKPFKPNSEQIEDFLDDQEDYEWLFEAFNEQLSESNATKKEWTEMKEKEADEMNQQA